MVPANTTREAEQLDRLRRSGRWATADRLMLLASVGLFALHFVHLGADFPHGSPWNDWAKYTDEGWYGDGAIRHFVNGRWYLAGDFNPAVAMPVWPLLEGVVFAAVGVSLVAARALAVAVFGGMLGVLYALLRRADGGGARPGAFGDVRTGLAAPLAVLLACANPFLFVFDRLAILEPLVAAMGVLALWLGSSLRPAGGGRERARRWAAAVCLGLCVALLPLCKPTAVALLPAIFYMAWKAGRGRGTAFAALALPALLATAIWGIYGGVVARLHLWEDYRYLFDANAYTGFQLEPVAEVIRKTLWDVRFVGDGLCLAFLVAMAFVAVVRPRFFRQPLPGALLLWLFGYLTLLGYHNNLQPRYYVLVAVPVLGLLALAAEEGLEWVSQQRGNAWRVVPGAVLACVVVGAGWEAGVEAGFLRSAEYSYLAAARQIAARVRANKERSSLVLSVSGSDLTLMTGLPSIDDDFGTMDLDERVRRYRPGWYVAWNELDDDKMDALRTLYQPVRVAAFPAMDDPDRNLLILYRLDPVTGAPAKSAPHRRTPRTLRTRSGQQPEVPHLRH